ncbi:MAG: helix-turn-helix domain-containing protein [Bdellovibrionales bacterium]
MTPEQFKSIREKHLGFSQSELAVVLGLASNKVISNIETGERNPGQLAVSIMSILASLTKKKALEFADLIRSHSLKEEWIPKRGGK